MTNADAACSPALPLLLLFQPGTLSSCGIEADLVATHAVTNAASVKDIVFARDTHQFSVAVLPGVIGLHALRASARAVRSQWPKARIVILGKVPAFFEDHLYDDAILHASDLAVVSPRAVSTLRIVGRTAEQ